MANNQSERSVGTTEDFQMPPRPASDARVPKGVSERDAKAFAPAGSDVPAWASAPGTTQGRLSSIARSTTFELRARRPGDHAITSATTPAMTPPVGLAKAASASHGQRPCNACGAPSLTLRAAPATQGRAASPRRSPQCPMASRS